jgi:hypothetical protein
MRLFWILSLLLISCSLGKKKNIVMETELEQSRLTMEEEINSRFDCFKQLLIDTDSSYNPAQPKGHTQQFYEHFLKLKHSKDSIVSIKKALTKNEWINILVQFSLKVSSLKGSERATEMIKKDLKFLKDNEDNIPEWESSELYKHIVERWTGETYESVLSNVYIDFIEENHPPCRL